MDKLDVQHAQVLVRRARLHLEETGIWDQSVDSPGAEEHCVDKGHRTEVYDIWISGRGCLC